MEEKDLYCLQKIVGNGLLSNGSFDRIPREKEVRGRRKLELLDIFASLINGDNVCTACFLNIRDNTIYISINEGDDEGDDKGTIQFAQNFLQNIQNLIKDSPIDNFDKVKSKEILKDVLKRNLNKIIKNIQNSAAGLNGLLTLLNNNVIGDSSYSSIFKTYSRKEKNITGDNILNYVDEADQLYYTIKQLNDDTNKKSSILLMLKKIAYFKWDYVKLLRCMVRFYKLGIDTFSSIENVIQVQFAEKTKFPMNISYNPYDIMYDLYDKFIDNNISNTNKICEYVDIKINESMINNIDFSNWTNTTIEDTFNGSIHAEMSLIVHLLKNGIVHGEIGVSKLCCSLCYTFMRMLTHNNIAEFIISGSHSKFYNQWAMPLLGQKFNDVRSLILKDIILVLYSSCIRKNFKSSKNSGVGQPDNDVNSETYSSDEEGHIEIL